MTKIPTLYSDYPECILDLDIYGKIVATPQQSMEEMKKSLFEEFQRRKPYPTLEYKRYELSRLVNSDYRIKYNKELELQDNEALVELQNIESTDIKIDFDNLKPLLPEVIEAFSYDMNITDSLRQDIISKYDLETGEEFKPGIKQTENIVGSVEEDKSLFLSEEKIANLGVVEEDVILDLNDSYEPINRVESSTDTIELEEDEGISLEDYVDSDDSLEDDLSSYEEEEDDLSSYEEEEDEDYDDFSKYEDDSESDDEVTEDLSDESEDDFDDFSQYADDSESDIDVESDDEFEDDFDDFSQYEDDSDSVNSQENEDTEEDSFNIDDFQDDFIEESLQFTEPVKVIQTPPTPAQVYNPPKEQPVDRSAEPTDIRAFLRKHPRCEYDFAAKYFTKKQLNDAIKKGQIIRKGNILKI